MAWRIASALMVALIGQATFAEDPPPPADGTVRIATYNIAMYGRRTGELSERLATGADPQAMAVAEVIQRVRPDVLLLCEIDYAPAIDPPRLFAEKYLAKSQAAGLVAIDYPHRFTAPVNTGVPSGLDLDRDGSTDGPADAWGFGRYPGQYGMALLSRFPIDEEATRTFQHLLWKDLPHSRMPVEPTTSGSYYSDSVWNQLRLPSKSFWDIAVQSPFGRLHALCSHPTPPVFDGPEDRNGCRNADEIELIRYYVEDDWTNLGRQKPWQRPMGNEWLTDDSGRQGGIAASGTFVILGDLNADPNDGDGQRKAIRDLLSSPRLAGDPAPSSWGAVTSAHAEAELNFLHTGPAEQDTADFSGDSHANLRVDYALPSSNLEVVATGVYWPRPGEPGAEAVKASDHRLVWVDVKPRDDAP